MHFLMYVDYLVTSLLNVISSYISIGYPRSHNASLLVWVLTAKYASSSVSCMCQVHFSKCAAQTSVIVSYRCEAVFQNEVCFHVICSPLACIMQTIWFGVFVSLA